MSNIIRFYIIGSTFLVAFLLILSCIISIITIKKSFKTLDSNLKKIAIATIVFEILSIVSSVIVLMKMNNDIIKIISAITFTYEFIYIYTLQFFTIKIVFFKRLFSMTSLFGVILTLYLSFQRYDPSLFSPLILIQAIYIGAISIIQFNTIANSLSSKDIENDPITLLILGLFFCYSFPFSINTMFTFIEHIKPDFLSYINMKERVILYSLSLINPISYIIFNHFTIRSFKCNNISKGLILS